MVKENKIDRRIVKTRNAIQIAFMDLSVEKNGFDDINIKELTIKAGINRATFYLHYKSVFDVIDDIENIIVEQMRKTMQSYSLEQLRTNPTQFFSQISAQLNDRQQFSKLLLSSTFSSDLENKIKKCFFDTIMSKLKEEGNINPETILEANILCIYVIGGVIDLYKSWFSISTHNITLEQMSKIVSKLVVSTSKTIQ